MGAEQPMSGNGAMRIRRARLDDLEGMLAIKHALRMDAGSDTTVRGGFLLGSSREQYRLFIEHASVMVLEDGAGEMLAGFAIALPDPIVRGSDLWARREVIAWKEFDPTPVEHEPIAYFEQLAILPERRYMLYAPALALAALQPLLDAGHRHLFATVVKEPIHNLAAVPLLAGMGARMVGEIDEEYDGVGRIVSELYYLDRSDPAARDPLADTALGRRVVEMMGRLAGGQ